MRILDFYIGRVIASTTFITLAVLVSISGIIKFVEQMRAVGRGSYDLADAALYALYSVPRDVEIFFPMAALIGGLIGLGMLANNSELVVMQASGLSKLQIIKSVMKSAALLILVSMAIGEWVAPEGEKSARELRARAISSGSLISAKNGVWAKDGDLIVHVTEVQDTMNLQGIAIYRFDDRFKMSLWKNADKATWQVDKKQWLLEEIEQSKLTEKKITTSRQDTELWTSSLTPDKLRVVTVKPESLSVAGLVSYLDYLEQNKQETSRYQLAFWRKLMQPITVAVMLLVALSYIFGPLRSVSMGARIMMGIGTGISYDFLNRMFGSMSLTFQFPPIIGAILPSLLFVAIAIYLLRRKA